jgi:Fic family protein
MKIENFKSGSYKEQYQYKSFSPTPINTTFTWEDAKINVLLEEAIRLIGELNAFTRIIPEVDIFIQMHIAKEANTSSKIEGTKTEIDEILLDKEFLEPEKKDDWQEVRNYIDAINFAIKKLETLPLCNRLIKQTHNILLQGVRGEKKIPGEYRKSQNWIGGTNLNNAYFIPPHHNEVVDLMGDLESFLNNDNLLVPHLIKIAIAHYQFETIHPFLDGNGRVGRLLITLYLVGNKILDKPSLYLSDFIEKNKTLYYDKLTFVREKNDLKGWIEFFLEAIIETSKSSIDSFKQILNLKNKMETKIPTFGKKAQNAKSLIDFLYKQPVISVNDIVKSLNISKPTANNLIKDFEYKNILKEITGNQRNKIYIFDEYITIYSKG